MTGADLERAREIRGLARDLYIGRLGNDEPLLHSIAALCASIRAEERERCAKVEDAARLVLETFRKDEAQGYRSRDRQFAITILGEALQEPVTDIAAAIRGSA